MNPTRRLVGLLAGHRRWVLAGILSLFLLLVTDRRRLPLPLVVVGALVGGLVLSDLTRAWGVVPVWAGLLLIALARNLRRRRSRPQV